MLYYSIWMALVVVAGVVLMLNIIKKVGGSSAKFFIQQQKAIGRTEGFVEEMMNGQKVIKVFCHEEESEKTLMLLMMSCSMCLKRLINTQIPWDRS